MRTKSLIPIMVVISALGGCAMMPKYARPVTSIPSELPSGIEATPASLRISDVTWQGVFTDSGLRKVIETALANNRDLRLAVLNVERSRALYGIQRAELLPSLSATGAGSKKRVPADLSSSGTAKNVEQYSVDLGISSWEIDLFGRVRSLKAQALEEYLATEQARRGAQVSLIGEVARAYFTVAADNENLKLAKDTLDVQRGIYGVIWQQYDKGIVTEADLRRSQTQVDAAARDVARYTQIAAQGRNALDFLVGVKVPEELLPQDLRSVTPLRDISPGLSSEVLLRRPDIMAAEHRLKSSYAYIGAARAAFFPRISLTTTLGTASAELSGLFDAGSDTWSFVPQASMPIFDTRTHAAYRLSKSQRDIALAQYEKAVMGAFREVSDALAVRGNIDQQVFAQESIVDSSWQVYELSNKRYEQGVDGYLSVLDAQRSYYAAKQALTALRLAKLSSQVSLYAVVGGDLDISEE